MNVETLSQLRATIAEIDALCAGGCSLDGACRQLGVTARSYRRWSELLAYSKVEETDFRAASIASVVPDLEAEFGREYYPAGDELFHRGDRADDMFVLVRGVIVGPGEVHMLVSNNIISQGRIVGQAPVAAQAFN